MYEIDMLEGALRSKDRRIAELERERDKLREALERLLYEGSQTSESEFIANRVKARAALEAGGDHE